MLRTVVFICLQSLLFVHIADAQFPKGGIKTDLSSTADRFLPLDLNGDGLTDMLYYRPGSGYAGVYLSHGDGTFRYVSYVDGGTSHGGFIGDMSSPSDTFVALDLNGDGKSDFIQYRPGGHWAFACLSVGDGSVSCQTLSSPSGTILGTSDNFGLGNEQIVALDLNGDGLSDFILYAPGHGLASAFLSNSNGTFTQIVYRANNNSGGGFPGDLSSPNDTFAALDLNGDGYSDFIEYRPGGGYAFECMSNGDGTVTCGQLSTPSLQSFGMIDNFNFGNEHILPLDLNKDGRIDFLLYAPGHGLVRAYLAQPVLCPPKQVCNSFVAFRPVTYVSNSQTQNQFADSFQQSDEQIIALDLNGDGASDFLAYAPGAGTATAYLSQVPSPFQQTASDNLTAVPYCQGGNPQNGFANDVGSALDTAIPLSFISTKSQVNLVGAPAQSPGSGFLWYRPGSGISSLTAYSPISSAAKLQAYKYAANTTTWMSDLSNSIANVPLKSVVMPGTHDSSMSTAYSTAPTFDLAITQSEDLGAQFIDGARVFDFRFSYLQEYGTLLLDPEGNSYGYLTGDFPSSNESGFYMYGHSIYSTSLTTGAALAKIRDYLNENPKEIVVLITNEVIKGNLGDYSSQFTDLLASTFPQGGVQIYSPLSACGGQSCNPNVEPQNMTPAQLWKTNQRLIIIDTNLQINATSLGWTNSDTSAYAGYCDYTGGAIGKDYPGMSTDEDELACAEVSTHSSSGPLSAGGLQSFRPYFLPAAAAPQFLELNTALTEDGWVDLGKDLILAGISPYLNATCNDPGQPACGDSSLNARDYFRAQIQAGRWQANALNFWLMDGIQSNDSFVGAILSRNDESWVNAQFFNATFPQAAGAIGVGVNGDIWAAPAPGSHAISLYKYSPASNGAAGTWKAVVSSQPNVKKIAVTPTGGLYWINAAQGESAGVVSVLSDTGASPTSYVAQDVAAGADGSVWIVDAPGTGPGGNGNNGAVTRIQSSPTTKVPGDIGGAGISVAVDGAGAPWVVNASGEIWRYNTIQQQWEQLPSIPATQTNLEVGDNTLSSDVPSLIGSLGWQASSISVGADGSVLVSASSNDQNMQSIKVGAYNEYVYLIPNNTSASNPAQPIHSLWRWDPSQHSWTPIRMDAQSVAVDAGGHPWAIRPDGSVYMGSLDNM
jgi:hypothetical protein